MKELKIIYDSFVQDLILDELKEYGIDKYIIIPNALGQWSDNVKKLNNHVWPGTNSILAIYVEDDVAEEIIKVIKFVKEDLGEHVPVGIVVNSVDEILL